MTNLPYKSVFYNIFFTLTILCFLSACAGPGYIKIEPLWKINTESGLVQGFSTTEGVVSWVDIPYAEPPVGDLRWRAPRSYKRSSGTVVQRGINPKICPQKADPTANINGEGIVGNEDCLYLDVRAPENFDSSKDLPVMVWIHGGGNTTGHKGAYNFSKFVAKKDVVVVTINYRLGPLGWLTHPLINQKQNGLDASSNFGTLDIIEALNWVNRNIGAFGGDSENITIFGESAGGHNVFTLLASPLASGLFQRAISQSGYVELATPEEAYNEGQSIDYITRSSFELFESLGGIADEQDLRRLSAADVIRAYNRLPTIGTRPLTTADGIVLPAANLLQSLAQSSFTNNVDVMAGATRDEVTLWLGLSRYFVDVKYPFTWLGPPVIRVKNPELYKFWTRIRSHAWKLHGVDEPLGALEDSGNSSLYAFRLDWDDQRRFPINFPEIFGAAHGVDISFVTGDYFYGPATSFIYPNSVKRQELEDQMMDAWANFARFGRPSLDKNLWPVFTENSPVFMRLDTESERGLSTEETDVDDLFIAIANNKVLSTLEKCLLVWDTLTNVREPDYQRYSRWNNSACKGTDAIEQKRRIEQAILDEFGTTDIF